jgi:8-oxo-dGTP diphosphatase
MALKREFLEETGLTIEVGAFRFGCEFVNPPLHAVELFFEVARTGGNLIAGDDPELQIIQGATFTSFETIRAMNQENLHGIFREARTIEQFHRLQGFYRLQ